MNKTTHKLSLIFIFVLFILCFPTPIKESTSSVSYSREVLSSLTLPISKLTASSSGYNSNRISWEAIKGASGYELYSAKGSSTTFTLIKTQTTTAYTHSSLSTNTRYAYKLRYYILSGSTKKYSAYSTVVYSTPLPSMPTNLNVVSSGYNSLKISWNSVYGATGYQVSYSRSLNGPYIALSNVSSTYTTLSNLKTNELIYVSVKAYRTVSYRFVYGSSSSIVSSRPLPSAPSVSGVSLNTTTIKLTWSAVSGATGYRLMAYNTLTKSDIFLKDVEGLSTSIGGLKTGSDPMIRVYAYTLINGEKILGAPSSFIHTLPIPEPVSNLKVSSTNVSSISLSWSPVSGASAYEIYRSTSSSGTYLKIGTSNTISYTSLGLSFYKTYYYKVKAYTKVNEVAVYGSISSYVYAKTVPSKVELSVNPTSSTSTRLSWPSISGVSGYEISYAVTNTYFRVLKTVSSNYYTHSSLKIGIKYSYKVRAYKLYGTTKIYGPYSSTIISIPDYSKEELLAITSKSLSTLLTKVKSQDSKDLVLKVKTAIDNYLKDPTYDFDSDAKVARKMFNQLSASDKLDLTVQGTLTLNLGHLDRLKIIFGY